LCTPHKKYKPNAAVKHKRYQIQVEPPSRGTLRVVMVMMVVVIVVLGLLDVVEELEVPMATA